MQRAVAIAGDFLPAGTLSPAGHVGWGGRARELQEYFADVATTFANLEATLDSDSFIPRTLNGLGQVVSAPSASLECLEAIRSRAVGIANNHSYDFGNAGVQQTRDAIARRGMIPLGAGYSTSERPEVFVWEGPAGVRVGSWAAAKAARELAAKFAGRGTGDGGARPAGTARNAKSRRAVLRGAAARGMLADESSRPGGCALAG